MKIGATILTLGLCLVVGACGPRLGQTSGVGTQRFIVSTLVSNSAKPNFETEIKPILLKCQPCHFQGGKVYDRMPFDKPETINRLGTKLFTRIKDEKEQRIIREFLAQP